MSSATEATEFWEERYRDRDPDTYGDRPNVRLPEIVGGLEPGTALDLACGPGGDTIWLARGGWHVTGVDISATAVERVAATAHRLGLGDRVRTERHDLAETFPAGEFDLVSAFYFHTMFELDRTRVLRRAAAALRPGGRLLLVDHGSVAPWMSVDAGHRFPGPAEVADAMALDPERFTVERADSPEREGTGPHGEQATVADHVLIVRRNPAA